MKILLALIIIACQASLKNTSKVGGRKKALVITNAADNLLLNGLNPSEFLLGERDSYIVEGTNIKIIEDCYRIEGETYRPILIDGSNSCELDPEIKRAFNIDYGNGKELKFIEKDDNYIQESCFVSLKNNEVKIYNLFTSKYADDFIDNKASFKEIILLESEQDTAVLGIKKYYKNSVSGNDNDLIITDDQVNEGTLEIKENYGSYSIKNNLRSFEINLKENEILTSEDCIVEIVDNNMNIYRFHGSYKFDNTLNLNSSYFKKQGIFIESNTKSKFLVIEEFIKGKDLIIENKNCKLGNFINKCELVITIDNIPTILKNSKARIQKTGDKIEIYDRLGCSIYNDMYGMIPKLKNEGFDCLECVNNDRAELEQKFEEFNNSDHTTKLIYYTGHGSLDKCREVLVNKALIPNVKDIKCKNLFIILDKCSVARNPENFYCSPSLDGKNECEKECKNLLKHDGEKRIVYIKALRLKPLHSTGSGPDDWGKLSKIITESNLIKTILEARYEKSLKDIKDSMEKSYSNLSVNYTLK